jgi:hypothetical protein
VKGRTLFYSSITIEQANATDLRAVDRDEQGIARNKQRTVSITQTELKTERLIGEDSHSECFCATERRKAHDVAANQSAFSSRIWGMQEFENGLHDRRGHDTRT